MDTNRQQSIPPLFVEIMENHKALSQPVVSFEALRRQRDLRRAAEKALSWNVDKGTKA